MPQLLSVVLFLACLVGALTRGDEDSLRPVNLSQKQRQYIDKEVLSRLASADFETRHRGLVSAARLGVTAVPLLLDLIKDATDPIPRRMAILTLGAIGDPLGRGQVRKVLHDKNASQDEVVAACFAAGLLSTQDADLRRELRARIDGREPALVRRAGAVALARLRDRDVLPDLLGAKEPIDLVRATFDLAVGLIGEPNGYRHLCGEAAQGNSLVRRSALIGLCNLSRDELGKDDPLGRPEAELRKRDEVAELALLAALSAKTANLTLVFAKAAEGRKDRQIDDVLFALAHARPAGTVDYFLEALPRWRGSPVVVPAILAAAGIEELEVSRLQPLLDGFLEVGDAASRRAAMLALFLVSRSLTEGEIDRLATADPDPEVRRLGLLVLSVKGTRDVARTDSRLAGWAANDARPVAEAFDMCRAILHGVQDPRLASDQVEEVLRQLGGRFGYRLAARRDQVLASALETDRLLWREDSRDRPPADGSGAPKGGGSDGGGESGEGGQGGQSGQGGGAQDGKLGTRRRGLFQNERIEHDLRLFLNAVEYFPRSWTGAARP